MTETTKEQRNRIRKAVKPEIRYGPLWVELRAVDARNVLLDAEYGAEVEAALREEKQHLLDDADIDDGTAVAGAKRMAACRLQRILDGGEKDG